MGQTVSPKEADAQAAILKAETEKALATLKPEQTKRLDQIAFQTGYGGGRFGGGGGAGGGGFGFFGGTHIEQFYSVERVVKELTITAEQTKAFNDVRADFEKEVAATLVAADDPAVAEKKVADLVAARRKKAEAVLTADQTTKVDALVGKPFTGSTLADRFAGARVGANIIEIQRTATFGKYTTDLRYLAQNKAVQEELKLDEKTIKLAADKYAEGLAIPNPFPGGDPEGYTKGVVERSKRIEEALGKLLDEDQAKRFRQIMIQVREQRPQTPPGARTALIPSAVVYPGVAEAVKLTDEQKKQLIAGAEPATVLTDAQKSAIKAMEGKKFDGDLTFPQFGTRPPQMPATVRLFAAGNVPVAEEDLKLTAEQLKALAAARVAYQKAAQEASPFGGALNPIERAAAMQAAYDAFDKVATGLLTAEQKPRFAQLVVQVDAAADLFATLTAPEMAKALNVTKEQTEKLLALNNNALKLHDLRTTHTGFNENQNVGLQMRNATDDRMTAVLTDAQKAKWKELTGEPLKGLPKTVPFGRGGFGGGGPGGGFGGPGGGFGPGGFGP